MKQGLIAAQRRGRMLMVSCVPGFDRSYTVMAIEFGSIGSLDDALDNHAHQVVADHVTDYREARGIAEAFLRSWKRGKPALPPPPACACGPIVQGGTLGPVAQTIAAPRGGQGAAVPLVTTDGPPPPMHQWLPGPGGRWALVLPDGTVTGVLEPVVQPSGVRKALPSETVANSSKSRVRPS